MSKAQRIGAALGPVISGIYRLLVKTYRYSQTGVERVEQARTTGRHLVFVLWHDELFPMPGYNLRLGWPLVTVVSQSRDGEILARLLQNLGLTTARGSSSKGGMRALVSTLREMRRGGRGAVITVDGPRGPRHEVKDGPLFLAHKANALLIPVRTRMSPRYRFPNTWDNFQIPYPFASCRLHFGEPYQLETAELDEQTLPAERARLQQKMDELGEEGEKQ